VKLLIRCDASESIGLGHLSRCLTLARTFTQKGVEVAFAMVAPSPAVRQWVENDGFPIHKLDPMPLDKDLTATLGLLNSGGFAMCIVDGYHFSEAYINELAHHGVWVCYMDDMINYTYATQAVFNQNFYSPAEVFRRSGHTDLILGPRFALLREEFAQARACGRVMRRRVQHVLVTMGGADPTAETEKVIAGLEQVKRRRQLDVHVVVGRTNPRVEAIHQRLTEPGLHHNYTVLESVSNMAEEMLAADIAISASGTTCMELLCMGLPSLIIVVVDNQILIGSELGNLRLAVNLGWHERVTPEKIAAEFRALANELDFRVDISRRAMAAVDGQGANRVVEAMLASYEKFKTGDEIPGIIYY
jgi:UDP-2,4-diacetamido-2,4,6-trideoxy-beta-L-altropyranose hydrolase